MIIAILFALPIIIIFRIFIGSIINNGGKVKTSSIILFLVLIGSDVFLYFMFFYPPQKIVYNRRMNSDKVSKLVNNNDFDKFLSNFKPVKLPLSFKAANFKYKHYTDIPDEYINKFFYFYNTFDFLNPDSFINEIKEPGFYNKRESSIFRMEIKKPKYLFIPIINDKFFACIFMFKVYNDDLRQKSQYMYLVTFDKKGTPLSCLKVGEATFYDLIWISAILPTPNTKSLCTINKDFTIQYRVRTGEYIVPGEFSVTGWQSPDYYKINDNGLIKKIQKKSHRIKRDE